MTFIIITQRKKYGCKAKLLFKDTNSLTYEIESNDVYVDFHEQKGKFRFREYNENSKFVKKQIKI